MKNIWGQGEESGHPGWEGSGGAEVIPSFPAWLRGRW